MRDSIVLELAKRWDAAARDPMVEDGSPDAEINNAVARASREVRRECAESLRVLVALLGDSGP